jgi:NAD(P)-dependent dehydrogenase (short-subunit alcohol dehydrogenase family)
MALPNRCRRGPGSEDRQPPGTLGVGHSLGGTKRSLGRLPAIVRGRHICMNRHRTFDPAVENREGTDMRLQDKVAIVTGAGSGTGPNQGIGKAFAKVFLTEGAKVVVGEIDEARGREVVEDLSSLGDISTVQLDVTDRESAHALALEVAARHGRIDILVNNAGIYGDAGRIMEAVANEPDPSWSFLQKVMDVNMFGPWIMSRAVVPIMISQGAGRIVNIASDAAFIYQGMLPSGATDLPNFAYGWSKWNLVGLTRFMAPTLGPYGIAVNCICPGITMTDATRAGIGQGEEGKTIADVMTQSMTALKKKLDPEDIANAALFLVSDDGAMVTGQTLSVDAGLVIGR